MSEKGIQRVISQFEKFTLEELRAIEAAIEEAIKAKEVECLESLVKEVKSKAAQLDLEISDVVRQLSGAAGARRARSGASIGTPKYRHPKKENVTWTGHGRRPEWFRDYVESGGDPDDLLIRPQEESKAA